MGTAISIAINQSSKTATITGDTIAIRETVGVTLTNTSQISCSASQLVMGVLWKGDLLASLGTSSNLFSSAYTGTINLNTCELVNLYPDGKSNDMTKTLDL